MTLFDLTKVHLIVTLINTLLLMLILLISTYFFPTVTPAQIKVKTIMMIVSLLLLASITATIWYAAFILPV